MNHLQAKNPEWMWLCTEPWGMLLQEFCSASQLSLEILPPSFVPVNSALLWGSFQLCAVLPVHLARYCKALQRIKAGSKDPVTTAVGDQQRTALLWQS